MPCRTDSIFQQDDRYERKTAENYHYLLRSIYDPNADNVASVLLRDVVKIDYTTELCAAIKDLSREEADWILYDGRIPEARKLADWWDAHKAADKRREENERKERLDDVRKEIKTTIGEIEYEERLKAILSFAKRQQP